MKLDELVRRTLHDMAQESGPPSGDLTGRVVAARARRRKRTVCAVAFASTVVVTAAITVPALTLGGSPTGQAGVTRTQDVLARPDQSPPRELIAAGRTAVAAWYTAQTVKDGKGVLHQRTWHLYNPTTGRYEKTPWAWVAVAPGMRTAAVLEGELPARRIGLLDLATGKVTRWIDVAHPVAGIEWSPDGSRLVATAYGKNPDRSDDQPQDPERYGSRIGFFLVDGQSGAVGPLRELPQGRGDSSGGDEMGFLFGNRREDLRFNHDGTLLYVDLVMGGAGENRTWFTLGGDRTEPPAKEKYASGTEAGLSPDGRLLAGEFDGEGGGIASQIVDPATGGKVGTVPGQQLLAWADNQRLIAWSCAPQKCSGKNEFRNRLVLVDVRSDRTVPLSGFREPDEDDPGRWTPVFATR
ncbi:WD40 repeat domain-containing protein [Streptomyces sp. TRM66268-LWL]|uniref:WD40 repeat domain-containing protein n=1 Tax=Streptomyces polyasparticus TaxID=2767826 RepID=A0ABR7SAA0_9ACTN|nr:WD40 repeat domain-containing protein [Streptomyces polyasparticus]MBC9711929.1 WD40 repeat domain-containing protein [Streptomyces polyasparticus]